MVIFYSYVSLPEGNDFAHLKCQAEKMCTPVAPKLSEAVIYRYCHLVVTNHGSMAHTTVAIFAMGMRRKKHSSVANKKLLRIS